MDADNVPEWFVTEPINQLITDVGAAVALTNELGISVRSGANAPQQGHASSGIVWDVLSQFLHVLLVSIVASSTLVTSNQSRNSIVSTITLSL